MVSIGPNSQSYNFTHMFDIRDLRGCPKKVTGCPNSLFNIINTNPDFTKFRYLVKLAKLETVLDNSQADFTLFIPSDAEIKKLGDSIFLNMDIAVARHIVKSSMLDYKITSDLLEDSTASYFITKDPPNRLFITNISGNTYINTDINIIKKDILATNGIIHVIDKLIYPTII